MRQSTCVVRVLTNWNINPCLVCALTIVAVHVGHKNKERHNWLPFKKLSWVSILEMWNFWSMHCMWFEYEDFIIDGFWVALWCTGDLFWVYATSRCMTAQTGSSPWWIDGWISPKLQLSYKESKINVERHIQLREDIQQWKKNLSSNKVFQTWNNWCCSVK